MGSDLVKQLMLARMSPSDILDVARGGIEFFGHQSKMEVQLLRARLTKQNKKIEGVWHFNEEVVNHYKSHITKLELEKEDLKREKRELSRNLHKQTQLGGGTQSLQLALQFGARGQVADDPPRIGQQANQTAAFDPDVEEIDFEDLEEEDFAPPPATNSRRETLQVV